MIDWKEVSKSEGYKSLKAAYIFDVLRYGNKISNYRHFQWVIGRACHYAIKTGKPLDLILKEWEEKRNYSWQNFYQNCNMPKIQSL